MFAQALEQSGNIRQDELPLAIEILASHSSALDVGQWILTKLAAERQDFERKQAAAGMGKAANVSSLSPAEATLPRSRRGGVIGSPLGAGEKSAADLQFESDMAVR